VIVVALSSPVAEYSHALFSVHMVQHLLLTLVAAPLLVLGSPVALAARSIPRSPRRRLTAFVHSRPMAAATTPVVAWSLFALVMWLTHFSPLYDRALDDPLLHTAEHGAYLAAGLLFFWPLAGLDPGAAGRMSHPARLLYLVIALPQQAFLGIAILSATDVLYPHYSALRRTWGPSPLRDQELAGVVMWVVGDMLFLGALVAAVIAWMRHDEREARRIDRRLGVR
jgi:putative copper resistance protein D